MANYTDEQLLLLDNLMYYKDSYPEGTSVAEICNDIMNSSPSDLKGNLSGGFEKDPAHMQEIAEAIKNDPVLSNLQVHSSMDQNSVYATCFTGDNGPVVAIRGTGGSYEAWNDNIQGASLQDTACQKAMDDYMQQLRADGINDITISGHSKGGNLAQYATVKNGDMIRDCLSVDGQGMGEDFINDNRGAIAANQGKMRSLCAENDYVNILNTDIIDENNTTYLHNDATGSDAHSSYELWKSNRDNPIDPNGHYTNTTNQDPNIRKMEIIADQFVKDVNALPDWMEGPLVNTIGSLVGGIFGFGTGKITFGEGLEFVNSLLNTLQTIMGVNPLTWALYMPWLTVEIFKLLDLLKDLNEEEKKQLEEQNNVPQEVTNQQTGDHSQPTTPVGGGNGTFSVDPEELDGEAQQLEDEADALNNLLKELDNLDYDDMYNISHTINVVRTNTYLRIVELRTMASILRQIARLYRATENDIIAYTQTVIGFSA